MGFAKPIEQYLFGNLLTKMHVFMYLKDIIPGGVHMFKLKADYTEYENKSLRLPKDLIDQVQNLANENNMSFNKVVIQCIEYALGDMESSD